MLQIISFPLERMELFWQGLGSHFSFHKHCLRKLPWLTAHILSFQKSVLLVTICPEQPHGVSVIRSSTEMEFRVETPELRFPPRKEQFQFVTLRLSSRHCCAHLESEGKYSCWPGNSCMGKNTQETDKQQLAIQQTALQQLFGIIEQPGKILINTWKMITHMHKDKLQAEDP